MAAAAFKAREARLDVADRDEEELPTYTPSANSLTMDGHVGQELAELAGDTSLLSAPSSTLGSTRGLTPPASEMDIDEDGPPPYSTDTIFKPAVHLQIETTGKQWLSLPTAPRPDPIPVYAVAADGSAATDFNRPVYCSLRAKRNSGSCTLVRADDQSGVPLSSTTYTFGIGKHPKVKLGGLSPLSSSSSSSPTRSTEDVFELTTDPMASSSSSGGWLAFELRPTGTFTRAVRFNTPLGLFEWRYAGRKERKALNMSSLLVLDHIVRVFRVQAGPSQSPASSSSSSSTPMGSSISSSSSFFRRGAPKSGGAEEQSEVRTPVARFLRNDEFRSPGSGAPTAGNGGRLVLDLTQWGEAQKKDREDVEVLAVTTCIAMLKKEVDRRRKQQIAIMVAAASGGA